MDEVNSLSTFGLGLLDCQTSVRRTYAEHSRLYNCIIVLVVSSLTLTWLRAESLTVAGVDFVFPLDPAKAMADLTYAYAAYTDNPYARVTPLLFPYMTLLAGLASIGMPVYLIQKMLFILMFGWPGLSMLYYASAIQNNSSFPEMPLISSLFYMLNPYVIALWQTGEQFQLFAYASVPLFLALIDRISSRPESRLTTCIQISLVSLLMAPAASWPPIYVTAWAVIVFYTLVSLRARGLRFALKTAVMILALSVLANAWWVLVSISSFGSVSAIVNALPQTRAFESFKQYMWFEVGLNASSSTLVNVARLFGLWSWFSPELGSYYQTHYGSVLMFIVSALFPALAFLSAIARTEKRKHFFLVLAVVGIFLAKSINEPFAFVSEYLYRKVPFGWIFVNNFQNFVLLIALAYSLLIADGCRLCVAGRPRLRPIAAAFVVLLILINSYPLLLGQVYEGRQTYQVPSYYRELGEWLAAQGNDSKALPLPEVNVYESFQWGYSGPEILHYFTGTIPLVFGSTGVPYETPMIQDMFASLHNDSNRSIEYARALHVRYILLDSSLVSNSQDMSADELRTVLQASQDVTFLRAFGTVEIYEIRDYIPIVYVPQRIRILDRDLATLPESEFPTSDQAFILKDQISAPTLQVLSNTSSTTILSFERQDPCAFKVRVTSREPFVLVVGVPYSESWVAQVRGRVLSGHFIVNGYANAWLIDDPGTYEVDILYTPQRYLGVGMTLSFVFVGSATVLLLVSLMISPRRHGRNSDRNVPTSWIHSRPAVQQYCLCGRVVGVVARSET